MTKAQRRRTQAERTEASDKAMFKAAIKLIAKEGPSHMTLAKLGKEAGFSGGLVSYRFGSKSQLLKATAERILELWSERVVLPGLEDTAGVEGLEKMAKLYLDAVAARSDLIVAQFRLMNESYSSYKELQPAFQEFDEGVRQAIVDMLEPAQEEGLVRADANLETFAIIYIGVLRGIAIQYFINKKAIDIEATYEMLEEVFDKFLLA